MRSVSINIDLGALKHNLWQVKRISPHCKIFAVLKANAYGHSATVCAKALQDADGFAVVFPSEAVELRTAGLDKPILVIQGSQTESDVFIAVHHNLTMGIHCKEQLELVKEVNTRLEDQLNIWIKLEHAWCMRTKYL